MFDILAIARDGAAPASDRPRPPPTGLHGVLGDWAVAGFGINICSIACSAVIILATSYIWMTNPKLLQRPSLRISTGIAVCHLMYSTCQLFVFNNGYMSELSEINLRGILWTMAGSTLTFVLLSTCMGIQLVLMVLVGGGHWARMLQPWYELASFVAGFLITHPYMYLFRKVMWIPTAQLFFLDDEVSVSRRNVWLIQWMWVFACIVFLFVIAAFTYLKMSSVWRDTNASHGSPEKLDLLDSNTMQYMSEERRRYVRSVTLRITMYPIIPVVTQTMVVVGNLLPRAPYWLFVMANIMPTFQGVLNFIAYAMNPALDEYRKPLIKRILGVTRKRDRQFGPLVDGESVQASVDQDTVPQSTFSTLKADHGYSP